MPRDGSGIYVKPFPDVVEGTTIESTVHNGEISDIEYDLNSPRPIVAGGTGANNAHDAMIALSGEIANQVVTNYDSFPFVPGSFASSAGATGAPTAGSHYSGICYAYSSTEIMIEARQVGGTGTSYVRQKIGGTWGAWAQQAGGVADLDAAYVNVAGDTMTGSLAMTVPTNNGLLLQSSDGLTFRSLLFNSGTQLSLVTQTAHPIAFLTNNATRMTIGATGEVAVASNAASTSPATGALTVAGGVGIGGQLTLDGVPGAPAGKGASLALMRSGNNQYGAAIYGTLDVNGLDAINLGVAVGGDAFAPASARLKLNTTTAAITYTTASSSPTTGALTVTGGVGVGAGLSVGGAIGANATVTAAGATSDVVAGRNHIAYNGGYVMNGTGTVYLRFDAASNSTTYVWNSVTNQVWGSDKSFINYGQGYKPGGGAWADTSDARIKNELGEYTRGLAEIVALRPIYYTFKGNDTTGPPEHNKNADGEVPAEMVKMPLTVPYPNSMHNDAATKEIRYTGLIAQEVEAVIPEMITKRSAYIDGQPVDDLRDLDTTPLIFALINAVKELKAEVDALKAAR